MRNDKLFVQCFAWIAIAAIVMCVFQENAFRAVVMALIAIALMFVARNIGHLIRCYRYQQRMFRMLRQLALFVQDIAKRDTILGYKELNDLIDSLDRIEEEIRRHTTYNIQH